MRQIIDADEEQAYRLACEIARRQDEIDEQNKNSPIIEVD